MSKLRDLINQAKAKDNGAAQQSGVVAPAATRIDKGGTTSPVSEEKQVPAQSGENAGTTGQTTQAAAKTAAGRFMKKGTENVENLRTELPSKPQTVSVLPETPSTMARPAVSNVPEPAKSGTVLSGYEEFRSDLDYLASHIEENELVGQVLRKILAQLQRNPQFKDQLGVDGVLNPSMNLIVRGLRRAYVTAARNKQDKRDKRTKKSEDYAELEKEFAEIGITF